MNLSSPTTTMTMKKTLSLLALALLAAANAHADVRLAQVFGEHMVLQREQPIRVWGWAAPGATLAVELAGNKATVRVPANGRWEAKLPARANRLPKAQ